MILVAQAIVHESAVMVKPLHTLIAIVAVHGVLWAQVFTINADVVEVQLLVDQAFHESQKVSFDGHIAWIYQREAVEEDGDREENNTEGGYRCVPLVIRVRNGDALVVT